MDADWLAGFENQVATLQAKAADLQQRMAEDSATASSQDESVTVTVGLTGVLLDIRLGHRACDLGPARLTQVIKQTLAAAQAKAAHRAAEAFAPMGSGTEAMAMLNLHLPPEPEAAAPGAPARFHRDEAPPPAPPAPPRSGPPQQPPRQAPPARPTRPQRGPAHDDDDDVELW